MNYRTAPKTIRPSLARLALAVAIALPISSALANPVASFSVTSFSFNANGGTLTFNAPDDYTQITTYAEDAGGIKAYDTKTSFSNGSITSTTPNASGVGSATASRTISGSASANTFPYSYYAQPNKGSSNVEQDGTFSLTGGNGSVTFNVGYTLTLSSPNGNNYNNYSEADLTFMLGTVLGSTGGTSTIEHSSFDTASGIATYTGMFTQTVTLAGAGDEGYYSLIGNTTADAPALIVPEPSEMALMFGGLAALSGFTIKRRRKA